MKLPNKKENPEFKLRVKTKAQKNEIISWDGETLEIRIKAIPEKGKANQEIIKFLNKTLKEKVTIKSGHTSKEKRIKFI